MPAVQVYIMIGREANPACMLRNMFVLFLAFAVGLCLGSKVTHSHLFFLFLGGGGGGRVLFLVCFLFSFVSCFGFVCLSVLLFVKWKVLMLLARHLTTLSIKHSFTFIRIFKEQVKVLTLKSIIGHHTHTVNGTSSFIQIDHGFL